MSKINVGSAKVVGDNIEIEINIDKFLEALNMDEVIMAIRHFTTAGGIQNKSIRLYAAKLDEEYTNKYQTHSLRINTYYRDKTA